MMFDNISTPLVQAQAGKVRALGVTSPERHPNAPEIPTMSEFMPGFTMTSWGGLCGPAGLPPAMVEKADALVKQALAKESVKKTFLLQAATTFYMTSADATAFRRKQQAELAPIIKASGAKVD
jgi:tripartite-type tricarboxylate transporter receptor subunit TctC